MDSYYGKHTPLGSVPVDWHEGHIFLEEISQKDSVQGLSSSYATLAKLVKLPGPQFGV